MFRPRVAISRPHCHPAAVCRSTSDQSAPPVAAAPCSQPTQWSARPRRRRVDPRQKQILGRAARGGQQYPERSACTCVTEKGRERKGVGETVRGRLRPCEREREREGEGGKMEQMVSGGRMCHVFSFRERTLCDTGTRR